MYESELSPGTTIAGRYILKEYKGSGSFGEVWLAQDSELGIDVAIKLYISLDQKGQDEFKDEYKVAYGLSHENLLTAQYYSVWNHRPYLIMKYCSRGCAGGLGGTATEEVIWRFIHDVAAGLKYLHAQEPPIVHQDIKPENILIDEQGNFLITDFGISKKMRSTMRKQSKRSIESGAISYMGPERFLKDPMAVKASDIWSLGVSIYELATDDLPFMGQGGGMLNAGAALPELDDRWSRNLNEVMRACLAKDTWDRPTAEALADYSRLVLKGKDISWSQWKTGAAESPATPAPRQSYVRYLMWIVVAAAAAAAVALYMHRASDDGDRQSALIQRYTALRSMCENNINVGSAQNYKSLLAAIPLADSLERYEREYPDIVSPETVNMAADSLRMQIDSKLAEAQEAWMRSARAQMDIAEDVTSAIMQYHLASTLRDNPDLTAALTDILNATGCQCVYMAVTGASICGNRLEIDYNGLNTTQINSIAMRYVLSGADGSDAIVGQADISILPGKDRSLIIALNGDVDGQRHLTLSQGGVVFYDSTIEDCQQ
ncbi:MAG: serine/threonine protein kinase [Bacteroides sp.]|nr:serine/threonine protein kinase [Bacteroides sp.]MCM1094845.1 serine/threonine protein kinase [Terasakiella sp.]